MNKQDEVDYWLYPTEVKQMVPIIEQLWLAPSKVYFPHVKLKCETEVGIRWDKENTPYSDLKWDEYNCPILEDAKYVKALRENADKL